ncbi:MAG: DUF1848 domain-containing protein [Eubacteriales bacterium]
MIISASRRSDIPAFYSEWFFNRLKEGFVLVRNPRNSKQISHISLAKDVVDGFVFWTKNPFPMMNRLEELADYPFYVQFSLNPYGKEVEVNVPSKNDILIPTFQKLSNMLGKERAMWRYDPILFNKKYTLDYHIEYFRRLAETLSTYTNTCTISFLDLYKSTTTNGKSLGFIPETEEQVHILMESFSKTAKNTGISLQSCAEEMDLSQYNVPHGQCIDLKKIEKITGYPLNIAQDKNQRPFCACTSSIDIGMYDSCNHGCLYCYANSSQNAVVYNMRHHNPKSPLLFGTVQSDDVVKEREVFSCRDEQMRLY